MQTTAPPPHQEFSASPSSDGPSTKPTKKSRRPSGKVLALILVVAAAAAAAIFVLTQNNEPERLEIGKPKIVSASDLSSYAKSVNRDVFWAGPAAKGFKLELTEVRGKRVFVRYLTDAANAGDPRAAFTTVATYPVKGAYATLRKSVSRPGAVSGKGANGATTLYYKKMPSSVFVASKGSDYLIEIFAAQPKVALQIANSPVLTQVR